MKNRFYLRSPHGNTGSNMVFHAIDGKGYTSNLDLAHVYTLEEAQKEWELARDGEYPISADHVDALAVWKVDHQYIPNETQPFTDIHNTYVAFKKGEWDGNDVYWLNIDKCSTSTDFDHASVFGYPVAKKLDSCYVIIPFCLADKAKRRTFDFRKLNKKTMVFGAGLKTPDHLKKARHRNPNPMTRFNCPECGKINWQHNPYDFEGCNHCCHGWGDTA